MREVPGSIPGAALFLAILAPKRPMPRSSLTKSSQHISPLFTKRHYTTETTRHCVFHHPRAPTLLMEAASQSAMPQLQHTTVTATAINATTQQHFAHTHIPRFGVSRAADSTQTHRVFLCSIPRHHSVAIPLYRHRMPHSSIDIPHSPIILCGMHQSRRHECRGGSFIHGCLV